MSSRLPRLCLALSLVLGLFAFAAPVGAAPPREAVIVVFHDSVENPSAQAQELGRQHRFTPTHVYQHALKGFAATVPTAVAESLRGNRNVAWVEADGTAYMTESPQSGATWGLDRVDQRALPLSTTYSYAADGTGVTAYVIDSGILSTHSEFGDRATLGKDFVGTNGGEDCNGHGTHVAGTIGGTTYGIAKNVSLVSVRVFDCSGGASWSTVIAAVDWVTANAEVAAVANMSLGGGANSSVDEAVRNSIESGVSYAIAAGNGDRIGRQANACNYSPARVAEAMTISATDKTDTKASWANYGNCVDWFAPGVSIKSAWYTSPTATNTISGTSMATPHTAGVAALYLEDAPTASPLTVREALYAATTKGVVSSSSTANNHLLYNMYPEGFPSAAITSPTGTVTGSADTGFATIIVEATDVEDGATPLAIKVSIDSGPAQTATQTSPGKYELPWDVSDLTEDSVHTIDATATDSDGLSTGATQVTVTVDNVDDPPTVAIVNPDAGETVSGILTVQVDADDDRDAAGTLAVTVTIVDVETAAATDIPLTFNPTTGVYDVAWDTTVFTDGPHTIDATATDANGTGLTGFAARVNVIVDNSITMHIASLTGSSDNNGSSWTAVATIVLRDSNGNAVNGALVTGSWSNGTTGSGSCTTGSGSNPAATCTISTSGIPKKVGSVKLTITGVTGTPAWDGSGPTEVTIVKP